VPHAARDLTQRQRHVIAFLASGTIKFTEAHDGYTCVLATQQPLRAYHLPADTQQLHR
jgi:hypothetical protein